MKAIKFGAGWCQPCKLMKPAWEKFKAAHPEIKCSEVDIDSGAAAEKLADKHGVGAVPTIIFVREWRSAGKKSETTHELVGLSTGRQIETALEVFRARVAKVAGAKGKS